MPPGFTPLRIAVMLGSIAIGFALFALLGGIRGGLVWGAVMFPALGLFNFIAFKQQPAYGTLYKHALFAGIFSGALCALLLLISLTTDFSLSDLKDIVPIKTSSAP